MEGAEAPVNGRRFVGPSLYGPGIRSLGHPSQDVLEDTAVGDVLDLGGDVDPAECVELQFLSVLVGGDPDGALGLQVGQVDVEGLGSVELERLAVLSGEELEGDDSHADEVGPVDPLEGLGDDGPDSQEEGSLGGPVPGASGSVLLSCEDDEGGHVLLVLLGGLEDGSLASVGHVLGPAALASGDQLVPEPDVGEGSPDHDLVVCPAGSVGVEVLGLDALGHEVASRVGLLGEGPCGGDVVGGDGIAELGEAPGPC